MALTYRISSSAVVLTDNTLDTTLLGLEAEDIEEKRLYEALRKAQLGKLLEELPELLKPS